MNEEKILLKYDGDITQKMNSFNCKHGGFCPICSKHIKRVWERKSVLVNGVNCDVHKKCLAKLYQVESLRLLKKSKKV